jgi:hypothetical protein
MGGPHATRPDLVWSPFAIQLAQHADRGVDEASADVIACALAVIVISRSLPRRRGSALGEEYGITTPGMAHR